MMIIGFLFSLESVAQGISFNAGLTPAQDRIVLRSQYRQMSMQNDMMKSTTQMVPLVAAYGLTPAVTVLGRGVFINRSFSNDPNDVQGFDDLFFMSKFRLYRKNTASYTIGVAPYIGSNVPVGNEKLSNRTLNPVAGVSISFRPRFFSVDFSTSYVVGNILNENVTVDGDIFNMNAAFSAIVPLGNDALSPVIELNYQKSGVNSDNSAFSADFLFLSPGASYIHGSLVFEALAQFPVYQTTMVNGMRQNPRLIVGVKYMF